MANAALIFPPQWPAFGPPLGIASLKAWTQQVSDHTVSLHDVNLEFYRFLLGAETVKYLDLTPDRRSLLEAIYETVVPKFFSILKLPPAELHIADYYTLYSGLDSFFKLLSTHLPFQVGLGDFKMPGNEFDSHWLQQAIGSPPSICSAIIDHYIEASQEYLSSSDLFGLSCISQSQVFWTLLLCRELRQRYGKPTIIGGSVFSRMAYRGCLPRHWFGELFDALCMHEGESPLVQILDNIEAGHPPFLDVRGVCSSDSKLTDALPIAVRAEELPPPNFDGLPLRRYLSPEIILPILCSRGCYWGKCEFCHHGMIYGGRYTTSSASQFKHNLEYLQTKYGANNFSIADEAIPPKVFRAIGSEFADRSESGFVLSGMLKFEAYFQLEDWQNAKRAGFDLIFVGLESASTSVLQSLKKMTPIPDIERNIREAAASDLWMHLFAFYGFPGETAVDADLTHNFLMSHSDEIGSIGIGRFSLEHGAPIFNHPETLNVLVGGPCRGNLDVYYDYECELGITRDEALRRAVSTRRSAESVPNYAAVFWCPREILPILIAKFGRDCLSKFSDDITRCVAHAVGPVVLLRGPNGERYLVRLANLVIYRVSEDLIDLLNTELFSQADLGSVLSTLESGARTPPAPRPPLCRLPVDAQNLTRLRIGVSLEDPAR